MRRFQEEGSVKLTISMCPLAQCPLYITLHALIRQNMRCRLVIPNQQCATVQIRVWVYLPVRPAIAGSF